MVPELYLKSLNNTTLKSADEYQCFFCDFKTLYNLDICDIINCEIKSLMLYITPILIRERMLKHAI